MSFGKIIYNGRTYEEHDYIKFKKQNKIIDEKVIVKMSRTQNLLFSIYNAWEHKKTFIPIDPLNPDDRTQFILNEINTNLLQDNYFVKESSNKYMQVKNIAYILYTSGSTGKPKGVAITYAALLNFIDGISEIIDFIPGKRIACLTTMSFDIFLLESIIALYKGLTVVLANEDEQRNPRLMAKLISDNNVDMIQMTPSRMQLLLNHDKELACLKNVKEIMIGGEQFPLGLLRVLQKQTTAKIYNMYGPTETTIWSTVSDLTHKDHIDIGCPIKNTEIYIVDENLYILPAGRAGEICIAGKGLATGYVGREDLTVEKFIHLPQKPNVKVYRTGDMGRYLSDGAFEYLGRTDNQVKIRGHRIELEEIESRLNQVAGIRQSVVIALETSETDKILEAFYTSDYNLDQKNILDYLSSKLPDYMLPAKFRRIENFIETANGKIDRKRVLECIEIKDESIIQDELLIYDLTDIQRRTFAVIAESIEKNIIEFLSLETDFNAIGLDSITFIKMVVSLESEFDFEFDDEMLLITKFPTVKSIVEYVESKIQ